MNRPANIVHAVVYLTDVCVASLYRQNTHWRWSRQQGAFLSIFMCHSIRPKFFAQAAIVAFDGSLLASRYVIYSPAFIRRISHSSVARAFQ
jgi:hypothetical protein